MPLIHERKNEMSVEQTLSTIRRVGVIPVIRAQSAQEALLAAEAMEEGGIPYIHTARWDQSGARKRPAQCLDVFGASDTSARKNFDSRSALIERDNQLGGSERARNG